MERAGSRNGDAGLTSLGDGTLVAKNSPRIDACGSVDELDCFAGLAKVEMLEALRPGELRDLLVLSISVLQDACWRLAASLAVPGTGHPESGAGLVKEIEDLTVRLECEAGPVAGFVIPGSSRTEALLHVARAVCRRAERRTADLFGSGEVHWESAVLNRMSSMLFAASRVALKAEGRSVVCRNLRMKDPVDNELPQK